MRKLLMFIAVVLLVGCGRYKPPPPPTTVPVKGKILLANGSPVPGGTIHFKPKTPGQFQTGVSEVAKDGSFSATSFNKDDGLQPGEEYTVTVDPVSYKTGSAVTIKGIPMKYQNASTSDLKVKVDKPEDNLVLRMR
jgi:hypothetical protein